MSARHWGIGLIVLIAAYSSLALDCYDCDSGSDDCLTPRTNATKKTCEGEGAKCYSKIDGDFKVIRGCLAKDDTSCTAPNCFTCEADACNKHLACKKCDGSDADCAQSSVEAAKYNQVCALDESCVVQVVDKKVQRSCGAATVCGDNKDTCKACSDGLCNKGIFPEQRLQCFQCAAGADCNDVASLQAKPCLQYDAADKCFTWGESNVTMTRGCYSDAGANCTASTQDSKCASCDAVGCNNLKYEREAMNCFQCSDAADCAKKQEGEGVACKPVNYTQTDGCFWQSKDNKVYRGCSNEREAQLGECSAPSCNQCSEKACNAEAVSLVFTCLRCRSDTWSPCRYKPETIGGDPCTNPSTGNDSCFHGEWDGVVVRGCMVDASELMQYQCNNTNDTRCSVCTEANCNNQKSGAGNPQLHHLSMGLAVLLALTATAAQWRSS